MAFTLRQWLTRAIAVASAGEDDTANPLLNVEDSAEALAHHVAFEVAEQFASDPRTLPLVEETVTISLTNGVGTLPSKVLVNALPRATVTRSADATMAKKMRYLPWRDFVRSLSSRFGSFSVRNGTQFNLVLPGATYTPGTGLTGDVSLTAACAPEMPATDSATIAVHLKVEEALVRRLAERLKGVAVDAPRNN